MDAGIEGHAGDEALLGQRRVGYSYWNLAHTEPSEYSERHEHNTEQNS
jgi:hypothetical protein